MNNCTNGSELTGLGATSPRDQFSVDSTGHDELFIGVDTTTTGTISIE